MPDMGQVSDGYHTFDELYEYRLLYNAMLFNEWAKSGKYDVHRSRRHSDGELCFGGGWFVVVATLPTGQISNHYKERYWNYFGGVPARNLPVEYDGHTPGAVLDRMVFFLLGIDNRPTPRPLPLHRTEAGYPNCSTCDGGGCPDCTDPA